MLNQLYQFSPLQKTVSIILLALVDGRPRTLDIKQILEEFLRHRVQVIRRRTEYLLREAKRRSHILEGQLIAISSLDEVIRICRASPSRAESKDSPARAGSGRGPHGAGSGQGQLRRPAKARSASWPGYHMTEVQADAVVRLQLGQLAALERDEIFKEYNQLRQQIHGYEELLANEKRIRDVIRDDLVHLRDKYGDERRTQIVDEGPGRLSLEDLIAEEENTITSATTATSNGCR